jgi:hypothetical protein
MASSRALTLVLLCVVLLSAPPPPVAAAFLFGGGKSAKKAGKAAGLGMEWQPATATWYGEADGDGSDGNPTLASPPYHITPVLVWHCIHGKRSIRSKLY